MVTNLIKNKIKAMTREQIIVSIDRLTRFKPTTDKYLRVFKEVVLNNLSYPIYKKTDLDEMDYANLTNIVQEIFNYSLGELGVLDINDNFEINKLLSDYENKIFVFDNETQKLLNNKISYKSAIKLFKEEDLNIKNLFWISKLNKNVDEIKLRENCLTHFPIEKIILAEGITEEILLPVFSEISGVNFDQKGYHVISAGGKNQVVKLFYSFADILRIPIFVLLDNDATENLEQIKPKIRKNDKIHLVQSGEFEDLLPINLIIRTLNNHLKNLSYVEISDFDTNISMVKNLENIYKLKGLEDYKKADFAHLIKDNIESDEDLSAEILNIVNEINS